MTHHVGMHSSINIPNFGDFADVRTVATVAAAAEEAGWDALFGGSSSRFRNAVAVG